jgi:predicted dehydrogenase
MRVAIVGCGKIADSHAEQVKRISGAEIVAACDSEPLMVRQFCHRYGIPAQFTELEALLREAAPTVVHVTTPPHTHYELALTALRHGAHVYVEKPFTVTTGEAQALIETANNLRLRITVGHDGQFSHAARRMRAFVTQGYLGGPPVHMESYYCYPFGSDAYGRALLGDRNHWVRRLPGKLLQNVISHGIASLAEFLSDAAPEISAVGGSSAFVRRLNAADVIDELRVIIREAGGSTAYFTFSSQMRPALHELRLYGPRNGLVVDYDKQTVLALRGESYKSYVEKFVPPLDFARQHVRNSWLNIRAFLRRDFHMKSGMKCLIESFYDCIEGRAEDPITHREILLTSRIMDEVFRQLQIVSTEHAAVESAVIARSAAASR